MMARFVISSGEPAGIGPDIVLKAACAKLPAAIVAVGDREMLAVRAAKLGLAVEIVDADTCRIEAHRAGVLPVIHRPCPAQVIAGALNPANSEYVIDCIDDAVDLCRNKDFDAMVTAPVHKAALNNLGDFGHVDNRAGMTFRGHTEWIAKRCAAANPVMMLVNARMRVCLLTTHLPLGEVPQRIVQLCRSGQFGEMISVIVDDLRRLFGIAKPALAICALNPHAGEDGCLGREEIDVIAPAVDAVREALNKHNNRGGATLLGPLAADTAFTGAQLKSVDAVVAMYHDQGLAVVKFADFANSVNLTLGLPIIRTSVDHGTALELAGKGTADESSLLAAVALAHRLAAR